jgi:hypothetical protein
MNEKEKLINSFKKEIEKAIYKVAQKNTIDLAFFGFEVKLTIYNDDFSIDEEIKIIDTNHCGRCMFCGEKSYYYDEELHSHICASCLGKLKYNKKDE